MQVSVQQIANTAIDLADMKYSQFIDQSGTANSELIRYLRIAYKDLYNQIVLVKENYFTIAYQFNLVAGTDTYALPSDFYKLNGVDLTLDAVSGRYLTLRPAMFAERNKYKAGLAVPVTAFGYRYQYLIVGWSSLVFTPVPLSSNPMQLWYTPEPVQVAALTDTLTLPPGGDEYMSLYVAEMMLAKEESDPSMYNMKRMEVIDQLRQVLKERDQGAPNYITDETQLNIGAFWPYGDFEGS